jgi:hypothetical protein
MTELTRRQFIGTAAGRIGDSPVFAVPDHPLEVRPRAEWAIDRPQRGPLSVEQVEFLLVHHSASHNGHTTDDAPAILRSFYDFHTGPDKGWNDIAYNFLIDSGGGVWEGRAGSLEGPVTGDATGGNQGFSQLVCVIGDYNTAEPTPSSLSSLITLLAWLADRYEVDTNPSSRISFTSKGSNLWPAGTAVTTPTITGHRTMSRTSCPGSSLNSYVEDGLMADVTGARRPLVAAVGSSVTSDLVPPSTPTTTTTLPRTPSPTGSPVVRVAVVVAALATLLAAWRARRMNDN